MVLARDAAAREQVQLAVEKRLRGNWEVVGSSNASHPAIGCH